MGGTYTPAQAKASRKYQEKTVSIQIRVTEEKREKYKEQAKAKGMSLTEYIINKLEN